MSPMTLVAAWLCAFAPALPTPLPRATPLNSPEAPAQDPLTEHASRASSPTRDEERTAGPTIEDDLTHREAAEPAPTEPSAQPLALAPGMVSPYPIVYVRQPRFGSSTNTIWPDVFRPAQLVRGADLMLLHTNGTSEVLVSGGAGSITDPQVSFDGQWVFYSKFPDLAPEHINYARKNLPFYGADIFRIHVPSRTIQQLTHGEFTPNTGAGTFDESNPLATPPGGNKLGYGILNLGACPLPGGKVAFTSNRNGFVPPEDFTYPTMQLFVMDEDGANVELIAPMNIGSALHPIALKDGRIAFSSFETQGLRDRRMWGIWTIWPDGRHWEPLASAFRYSQAFHFATQLSGEDIVFTDYYNLNNNGFGALYRMPIDPPGGGPRFWGPRKQDGPGIAQTSPSGNRFPIYMAYMPRGLTSITPFTHATDWAAPVGTDGVRVGKFTQPCAAPGGDLLVVWSPGPCNNLDRPTPLPYYDGGIYLAPQGRELSSPRGMHLILNSPDWNEAWPRPLVPYAEIHGVPEPAELPWLPNDGTLHQKLPRGTPYGIVGASSFYRRESEPKEVKSWLNTFDGRDAFNSADREQSSNWFWQGADAGIYQDSDIWAVRILAMEPNTDRSYGAHAGSHYFNHANEKLRILGEIPLRKVDAEGAPLLDPTGAPDTSFLARIPADTPFTFQTIDAEGMVLNMAQTWHQVRPGEVRTDCGGCHAHSQEPLPFEDTAAGQPGAPLWDLVHGTTLVTNNAGQPGLTFTPRPVVDVEFIRDVRPILQEKCTQCHTKTTQIAAGNLVLDDFTPIDGLPGDYFRLANDTSAQFGHPPVMPGNRWRQTNASRYIRKFQSRRSLLVWKIYGRRLDGWTNADHPTEYAPGNISTLPDGATAEQADLDFTGTIMPPPGSGITPLTPTERRKIVRWIDLGCPIDLAAGTPHAGWGFGLDDLRPTLTLSSPRAGTVTELTEIRIGATDAFSGVDWDTLSVRANFRIEGRPQWAEVADLVQPAEDGVVRIPLTVAVPPLARGRMIVTIKDHQGNITRVDRSFTKP